MKKKKKMTSLYRANIIDIKTLIWYVNFLIEKSIETSHF